MKVVRKILLMLCILFTGYLSSSQSLNVGITFQYFVLKQIKVDSDIIEGTNSYSLYQVKDNRWKFFSAGQSIVIGSVFQLDYKKLYVVLEPSFDLNTSNYTVDYPIAPDKNERLNFQTLFLQVDVPLYIGYQFGSTNLIRYSVFGGGVLVLPYGLEYDLKSKAFDNPQADYFNSGDMENVLYNGKKYLNTLAGFCVHFANLGKIDVRYQHRLGSPGTEYAVSFNSVGVGITYYLPINLRKKKIYYED